MEFVTTLAPNCLCDGWERKKKVWPTILALARCNIYFVRSPLLIIIKHVGNKLNVHVVVIWFFQGFRLCHRPIFKEKIFAFFFWRQSFDPYTQFQSQILMPRGSFTVKPVGLRHFYNKN